MGLGGGSTAMSIFGPSYGYGYVQSGGGGGGVGTIVILGIIAALAISFLPGILSGNSGSLDDGSSAGGFDAHPIHAPASLLLSCFASLHVLHIPQLVLRFCDPAAHSPMQLSAP